MMILHRYVQKELLSVTFGVAALLSAVLLGGRVIKYFSMAAEGRLDIQIVAAAIGWLLPSFLQMILPLSLFIALLLVVGRLHVENEMAVLSGSGLSRLQLLGAMSPAVLLVTVIVGMLSLAVTPYANRSIDRLFAQQARHNVFQIIQPGVFMPFNGRIVHAEGISADKKELRGVMIYTSSPQENDLPPREDVLFARVAHRLSDPVQGEDYIELTDGVRYQLTPGSARYSRQDFRSYRWRLSEPAAVVIPPAISARPTGELRTDAARGSLPARAELAWRCSMVLFAPVALLLSFPIARVNPRQGRFVKVLPGILLYVSFVVLTAVCRNALEKGRIAPVVMLVPPALYVGLALWLMNGEEWKHRLRRYRRVPA